MVSEKIKNLLREKKIEEANKILGYNYYINKKVEHGLENGRKIGFRTINQEIDEKILPDGVYITKTIINNKIYKSMTNIGTHPSVSELNKPIIETHIINFDEDLYGQVIKVEFFKFLRDQKKFGSLDSLIAQLKKDSIDAENFP